MKQPQSLKRILWANASFSTLSAITLGVFTDFIAEFIALPAHFALRVIAVGLLLFALFVGFVALKKAHVQPWVYLIILQDVLWVLGSIWVCIFNPWQFSIAGLLSIALVAGVITFFAWKQWSYQ